MKFELKTATVYQFASLEAIRKVLATYGDGDRQTTQLRKWLNEGWYPVNKDYQRVTGLTGQDGKVVLVKVGDKMVPADWTNSPTMFLNAAYGLRFKNEVYQIAPEGFVPTDGTVPDVGTITQDQLLDLLAQLGTASILPAELAYQVNNGLRLGEKATLKPASKRATEAEVKSARETATRTAFLATNPPVDVIATLFSTMDYKAMEKYITDHPTA